MANYAYVQKIKPALTAKSFESLLTSAVLDVLGSRWKVARAEFEDDGPVWLVTVPDTANVTREMLGTLAGDDPEDVGWIVALQCKGAELGFRHGPNSEFARWAQGCIEEELSERLNAPLYYDAGPTTYKPGHRDYRLGNTFRAYLLRNFYGKGEVHETFIQKLMRGAPEGFRD
jgi:hypothetical protein